MSSDNINISFEHLDTTVPEAAYYSTFPYVSNNLSFIWTSFLSLATERVVINYTANYFYLHPIAS